MLENPLPIIQFDPHSGLEVPVELQNRLLISQSDIYNDADLCADQHFDFAHPDLADLIPDGYTSGTLCTVHTPIARVLVDANRYPDDHPNGSPNNPDGIVKSWTSYGKPLYADEISDQLRSQLIQRYYDDYHRQAKEALTRHGHKARLLLDCHNMAQQSPDAYPGAGKARPLLCIVNMGDPRGLPKPDIGETSCSAALLRQITNLATDLFADMSLMEPQPGVEVPIAIMNQPFWGGYVLRRYSRISNPRITIPAFMIEVNRGLFMGNQQADSPVCQVDKERISQVRQRLYQLTVEVLEVIDRG